MMFADLPDGVLMVRVIFMPPAPRRPEPRVMRRRMVSAWSSMVWATAMESALSWSAVVARKL